MFVDHLGNMKVVYAAYFLVAPCLALRLQSEKPSLCVDAELDQHIGPLVQDCADFFASKGHTLYPIAVSGIGALRYGGNTALVDGERHIIDHDVDFLVVGPSNSSFDKKSFASLHNQLTTHLTWGGWQLTLMSYTYDPELVFALTMAAVRDAKGTLTDGKNRIYSNFPLDVKMPVSALTGRFFSKGTSARLAFEHIKNELPAWARSSSLDTVEHYVEEAADAAYRSRADAPDSLHIDLFYILGPQEEYQPHPTKKLLFHGVIMRYPNDSTMMISSLQFSFWDKQSPQGLIASQNDICAFSSLGNFPDDMNNTEKNTQVARACSRALEANGYESFTSLHC